MARPRPVGADSAPPACRPVAGRSPMSPPVRPAGDDRPALADGAHAHPPVGPLAGGEPGVPLGALQQLPAFGQPLQGRRVSGQLGVSRLVAGQGPLAGGAGQVLLEDVAVRGVGHGVLDLAAEELLRVPGESTGRGASRPASRTTIDSRALAADASGPLPGADDRPGVAHEDAEVQPADVDAELQGGGADHPEQVPGEQAATRSAGAPRGRYPRPVGADPFAQFRTVVGGPPGRSARWSRGPG